MSARGGSRSAGQESSAEPSGEPDVEPRYVRFYRSLLEVGLRHPVGVALVGAACLGGSFWLFDRNVERGVLWSSSFGQETYLAVNISLPRGAEP